MTNEKRKTLVLNSSYMASSIIPSYRAFSIHYKGNADVITTYQDTFITTINDKFPVPSIIRVPKWFEQEYHRVPLTRENLYKRDNYTCVYCGLNKRDQLTIDHLIPVSKGGKDTWENWVTACRSCNSEKSNLDVEEWAKEVPRPYRPHYLMLVNKNLGQPVPDDWKPYLFF
jgi:hypothetical protein